MTWRYVLPGNHNPVGPFAKSLLVPPSSRGTWEVCTDPSSATPEWMALDLEGMILSINRLRSEQHCDLSVSLLVEMVSQATLYGIWAGPILESHGVMSSLVKELLLSELVELQALWN